MTEFNLSDKIFGSEDFDNDEFEEIEVLHIDSVKEFIRLLKEAYVDWIELLAIEERENLLPFDSIINQLAGDKLK